MKILFTKKVDVPTISKRLGNEFEVDSIELIKTENQRVMSFNLKDKTLIFTSTNGVHSFLDNGFSLQHNPILVVGTKTEKAVVEKSGQVEKTFAYASEMAEFIKQEASDNSFVHFCGNLSLDILPESECYQKIISYHTHLLYPKIEETYDALVFFSPSGVRSFALHNSFEKTVCFAIGNTTTQALQQYTNLIMTSSTANLEGILNDIIQYNND